MSLYYPYIFFWKVIFVCLTNTEICMKAFKNTGKGLSGITTSNFTHLLRLICTNTSINYG